MSAGLRYVTMSPNLLKVIGRALVFGLSAIVVLALLPLVARDLLGGGAITFGLLLGSFGVGALGGGLLNARIRAALSTEAIVRLSCLGFALAAVLMAVSREVWLTCLVLMPTGACWVLVLSLFNVLVQLTTPRWVVGRTLSIYQTAVFGGMSAGAWVWGLLAEHQGTPVALFSASALCLVVAGIGLRFQLPKLVSLDLDPLNQFQEPPLQLDIRPRSGPIMILLDYDIAEGDVQAFLDVMVERRRIRIRDGAQHWVLLRDLEHPGRWTESYHVPTWVEYVRHNVRRTRADADVTERLRQLNGGRGPQVRRMIERHTVPRRDDLPIRTSPVVP